MQIFSTRNPNFSARASLACFNVNSNLEPFRFEWDWLAPSGLSTKDFVAPSSLCFGTAKTFGLGGKYGAVSFLQILAPELSDEMLADFLKTESGILLIKRNQNKKAAPRKEVPQGV